MSPSSSSTNSPKPDPRADSFLSPPSPFSFDQPATYTNNYLNDLDSAVLSSLDQSQIKAINQLINTIIINKEKPILIESSYSKNLLRRQEFSKQKPKSKLIDIHFIVDLVLSRFYVVLLVGKDIRKETRNHTVKGITKIGNIIAAIILVISINLFISACIALSLYLLKSALEIDLFPGHISEQIENWK